MHAHETGQGKMNNYYLRYLALLWYIDSQGFIRRLFLRLPFYYQQADISYGDTCIKLSILPLSFRREIHDLSFIFNCFHAKVICNFSNCFKISDTSTGCQSAQSNFFTKDILSLIF